MARVGAASAGLLSSGTCGRISATVSVSEQWAMIIPSSWSYESVRGGPETHVRALPVS